MHWLTLHQPNKARKKTSRVVSFFSMGPGSSSDPAEVVNKIVSGSQVLVNGLLLNRAIHAS